MVRHAVWFGLAAILAACQTPPMEPESAEDFGNAVRHNIAVQTLDPEGAAIPAEPSGDGNRAALAIGRYQTDQVKRPAGYSTSSVSTRTSR